MLRSTIFFIVSLLCLLLFFLPSAFALEQKSADVNLDSSNSSPQYTMVIDPLTTALGYVHLQTEITLSDQWSIYLGPHARLFDGISTKDPSPYLGFGAEVGLRRFFSPNAPKGAWLQVRGVGALLYMTEGDPRETFGGYGSALGGYSWILDGGLVFSAGLGIQYIHYQIEGLGVKGILPAAHTAIGYAW